MTDKIEDIYAKANSRIKDLTDALARGDEVDLTGIDKIVAELCAEILNLPVEDGKVFKPKLEAMIDGLKILSENLQSKQNEVRQQISSLGNQQKAAKAYISSDHLAAKKSEGENG